MNFEEESELSCSREIIGIAGNIGAGKSVVSRILRCNGFLVYDCDREASILMNNDYDLRLQLIEILGEGCYMGNGCLDRSYVSSKIFCDAVLRARVNSVVHEAVRNDFRHKIENKSGKVFVESAIMVASGLYRLCDSIWLVDAPEATRIRRVMSRSNIPESEVRKRIDAQKGELSGLPEDKVTIIENADNSRVLDRVISLVSTDAPLFWNEFHCLP